MTRLDVVRRAGQLVRYAGVSVVSTVTSLTILTLLVGTASMGAALANVVATAAGTVPSFELNRRWVWGRSGRPSLRRQVMPFVALSFTGLVLSTVVVHLTGSWVDAQGWNDTARAIVAAASSAATFGTLWLAQFVILDRVLFSSAAAEPGLPGAREVAAARSATGTADRAAA